MDREASETTVKICQSYSIALSNIITDLQLGTALHALKSTEVIHSDIKLDNIMLDCEEQPLRVKLIDFELAFLTYKVKQGAMHQTKHYR